MDFAGLEIPSEMQGMSIKPLLEERETNWRDAIYYHYYEYPGAHSVKRHYGIRTDRYKLIHFYDDIDAWEFFDLQNDPDEMHNLYGQPAQEGIIEQMRVRLGDLRKGYAVPET